MSRALTFSLFALALFVGTTGGAQSVHAVSCVGDNSGAAGTCTASSACLPTTRADSAVGTCSAAEVCCSATNIEFSGGNAQTIASDAKTVTKVSTGPVMNSYLAQFMNWVASLFAWLLGVAALMLDYSVHYTVVTMGEYVKNLTAVGVTWQILRDIGNILLIFGFLAIGVTTILNVDWYGGGKKMLPMLLVGAVFLNFSLFFTQAIIDVGNLFATQFYTQINGGQPSKAKNEGDFMQTVTNEGISNKLMNQLGLTQIYNAARTENGLLKDGNSIFIGFMSIIVFLIAAFVMFSLAFILIARFVILLFLIILAPIGFAGLAIPQMKKVAGLWWHKLFEQTVTAPILLLLLYIALAVITDTKFLSFGGAGKWTGFAPGSSGAITDLTGFGSMVLSFLVAMGLLLAVVMVSKSLSAFGAGHAMKWGGRLTFGATALGASAMLNVPAAGARKLLQRYTPTSRGGQIASRIASRGLRLAEGARLDVRRIPGVGAGLSAMSAGEAAEPIAKTPSGRVKQATDWWKKSTLESEQAYQRETIMPRFRAAAQEALLTGDHKKVNTILSSITDKDLESSSMINTLIENPNAAALLSQARFDKLMQSEAISESKKADLATARRNGDDPTHPQSRFNIDPAVVYGPTLPGGAPHPFAGQTRGAALIRGMDTTTRGKLPGNILTENIAPAGAPPAYIARPAVLDLLDAVDFEAIRRNSDGKLTSDQRAAIGAYILAVAAAPVPAGAVIAPRQADLLALTAVPAFRMYYMLP